MKLQELFLVETTGDDRELISLASSIYDYLQKYNNSYDSSVDYDNIDNDDIDHELDIGGDEDSPVDLGTVGHLFDTSLDILKPLRIQIQSDYGIRQRRKKERNATVLKAPGTEDIRGLWYSDIKTMVLNSDMLDTKPMRSIIVHELRHALDDFKSNFKANSSNKYSTPKNKLHRVSANDPKAKRLAYLAEPAEINARFLQLLDRLAVVVKRGIKLGPETTRPFIINRLMELLDEFEIAELFPEKEKSKDYKRLIKRAMDFVEKELKFQSTA
jgi:hypothetical protein